MAADGEFPDERGSVDIGQQVMPWTGFTTVIKYSTAGIGLAIIIPALFRTHG